MESSESPAMKNTPSQCESDVQDCIHGKPDLPTLHLLLLMLLLLMLLLLPALLLLQRLSLLSCLQLK